MPDSVITFGPYCDAVREALSTSPISLTVREMDPWDSHEAVIVMGFVHLSLASKGPPPPAGGDGSIIILTVITMAAVVAVAPLP